MKITEIMAIDFPRVTKYATIAEASKQMLDYGTSYVIVVDRGTVVGLATTKDILRFIGDNSKESIEIIMTPSGSLHVASTETTFSELVDKFYTHAIRQIPIFNGSDLAGVVTKDDVFNVLHKQELEIRDARESEEYAVSILNSLMEGLIVIDRDAVIRQFNPAAEALTGLKAKDRIGKKGSTVSTKESPVYEVLQTGKAIYNKHEPLKNGRTWTVNYVPMVANGQVEGVIQTFWDVTEQTQLENNLLRTLEELDKAFSLTLPNTNMEAMLKNSPEYHDEYDRDRGLITITGVIPDGGYRHVVNGLKVVADFKEKGLMRVVGLDKDTLVSAIVFHDIGKSQPLLKVGDVVDPRLVFEDSKKHAARSADIAGNFYLKEPSVVTLIRYHHHNENELPADFPTHLLPSYRLLRLVDGLSAGITRRESQMTCDVSGTKVMVHEHSKDSRFNRSFSLDIYTGDIIEL